MKKYLLILLLMLGFVFNVNAAAPSTITLEAIEEGQYIYGDMPGGHIGVWVKHQGANYVYCIEQTDSSLHRGDTLTRGRQIYDPGVITLIQNGYPNKKVSGLTDKENYYITQIAVWAYWYKAYSEPAPKIVGYLIDSNGNPKRDSSGPHYNFNGGTNPSAKQTILANAAMDLYELAVSKSNPSATSGGGSTKTGTVTISVGSTTLNNMGTYLLSNEITITLKDIDSATVSVNKGKIVKSDNTETTSMTITSTTKIKVKMDSTADINDLTLTVRGTYSGGDAVAYVYTPPKSGQQDSIYFTVEETGGSTTQTKTFRYTNTPTTVPKVKFSKKDATNNRELPGATLVIKDSSGNPIESWVSTTTPHEVELDEGNYELCETIAPAGYQRTTTCVPFTVTSSGCSPVTMVNQPTIPATGVDKTKIILISSIVMLVTGIGVMYLGTRKAY